MDCKNTFGFSFLELLASMAIVAIVLLLAAPTFTDLIRSNHLNAQAHLFISAASYARAEAIQRQATVYLCVRYRQRCRSDRSWQQGWLVFVDENRNAVLDDGELMRVFDALEQGYTLQSNVGASTLAFLSAGEVRRSSGALPLMTFRLCAPDAVAGSLVERSREIVINATGRMRLQFGREIAGAC